MKLILDNVEICLDIGCGKGELSFMLAQKSKRVIAVDLADKMIKRARNEGVECEKRKYVFQIPY
jgi:2-polyprenyl-3-methyl-5-hydroxy-6-metoxy-1,4-benzoquinol methylase